MSNKNKIIPVSSLTQTPQQEVHKQDDDDDEEWKTEVLLIIDKSLQLLQQCLRYKQSIILAFRI